jgi:hypothetical protein
MIIKKRDSKQFEIDKLLSLLSLPLPNDKKFLIEREFRFMKSGDRGENDSSYYIDYYYTSSKNWAVIHDFRLEHDKRVAQIDHLLINRFLDIYVLESKNFSYGLKITDDGQFLIINNNDYIAIESPLEQNKRHVALIEKFIEEKDIVPKRLGLTISPSFKSYVLISPKSRLIRPSSARFNTTSVIKADTLKTTIENAVDNMSPLNVLISASKMCSSETLMDIAKKIVTFHKPFKIDYIKRFGIKTPLPTQQKPSQIGMKQVKRFYCSKCKKTVTQKVACFCWDNKKRFGGKAYCFDCQKDFLV